jgi:hypothetical protein
MYDLDTLEDGIPCLDQRHQLLVEHDELFVLDLLRERQGRDLDPLPIPLYGEDAVAFRLEMLAAIWGRRREIGLRDQLSGLRG